MSDVATATDLSGLARAFWVRPTPRILAAALSGAVVARALIGQWAVGDLVVVAVILGFQPFTEWLIHVFLLHFRPRTLWGRRIDPLAARKHRAHHRDPRDLRYVFVPLPVLVVGIALIIAVPAVALPLPLALTAMVTALAMFLAYEWTHYLTHTPYRPRGRVYRYIWRAHRLHHYRNEHYWFGVTMHLADHVLGTFPAKSDVELSPTARSLHDESSKEASPV